MRAGVMPVRCLMPAGSSRERSDAGLVLWDVLVGVVARAHQRTGGDVLEPELTAPMPLSCRVNWPRLPHMVDRSCRRPSTA